MVDVLVTNVVGPPFLTHHAKDYKKREEVVLVDDACNLVVDCKIHLIEKRSSELRRVDVRFVTSFLRGMSLRCCKT